MKITKNELKQIIKEELEATLSENEDAKAAIIARLLKGKHAASYAGSPGEEAAALILQAAPKDQKNLITVAAKNHSDRAIAWLKTKVQTQVAKKPATKPTTKTTRVSGTPPAHEMETVVKDGYVIATATTKDGVVGTGKAKIRPATGRHGAESAAKLRAQVALMDAVSQRKRTARGGVPPQ